MRICGVEVYLGLPDIIKNDTGNLLSFRALQTNAKIVHIKTKAVPIDAEN